MRRVDQQRLPSLLPDPVEAEVEGGGSAEDGCGGSSAGRGEGAGGAEGGASGGSPPSSQIQWRWEVEVEDGGDVR